MTITKADLKGKSIKQQAKLIRANCPEIIAAVRKEAKLQLQREGKIKTKLEGMEIRRKISARAGIKAVKK